jgi:hypothetical protein
MLSPIGLSIFALSTAACAGVIIGEPTVPSQANSFPFGNFSTVGGIRYQQLYASSSFPGPLTITDIEFYTFNGIQGSIQSGTYTISLSTTSTTLDDFNRDLTPSDLDSFVGPDAQVVDTLVVGAGVPVTGGSWEIVLPTPFAYDPSGGNLLLDISITGFGPVPANPVFFDGTFDDAGAPFNRALGCTLGCGSDPGAGLATGFDAAVPEPTSYELLGASLAALWFCRSTIRRTPKGL